VIVGKFSIQKTEVQPGNMLKKRAYEIYYTYSEPDRAPRAVSSRTW